MKTKWKHQRYKSIQTCLPLSTYFKINTIWLSCVQLILVLLKVVNVIGKILPLCIQSHCLDFNRFFEIGFTYHIVCPFKMHNSMAFNYIHRIVHPSPLSILEHFHYHKTEETLHPLVLTHHTTTTTILSFPPVHGKHLFAFYLCGFTYSEYFICMCPFVFGFFHLAWCFQGLAML
jgi:hypothetical protein